LSITSISLYIDFLYPLFAKKNYNHRHFLCFYNSTILSIQNSGFNFLNIILSLFKQMMTGRIRVRIWKSLNLFVAFLTGLLFCLMWIYTMMRCHTIKKTARRLTIDHFIECLWNKRNLHQKKTRVCLSFKNNINLQR
jgi:hypothetical protein